MSETKKEETNMNSMFKWFNEHVIDLDDLNQETDIAVFIDEQTASIARRMYDFNSPYITLAPKGWHVMVCNGHYCGWNMRRNHGIDYAICKPDGWEEDHPEGFEYYY